VQGTSETDLALSIFTVTDGAITNLIQYWPATYPPATWRSAWVEIIPSQLGDQIMTSTTRFQLSPSQVDAARSSANAGKAFLESVRFPLGRAMVDYSWNDGPASAIYEHLDSYQNADGGFGRGLEVDIKSPASNPFATRLAMHVLLGIRDRKPTDLESGLQDWLVANQDPDGDWHLSDETKAGELAPWFAAWQHPGLNPACCVVGLADRLGLATPEMLGRVARLFDEKASLEEARSGEFYNVLPYVEYVASIDQPDREAYLDAIAENIIATVKAGKYPESGHFWEHVLGGGNDLVGRIPGEMLAHHADTLIAEQEADGGWPTPYDQAWRPYSTASNLVTLARLRDGIQ
jgi:hypothetical protein